MAAIVDNLLKKTGLKEGETVQAPAENDVVRLQARFDAYDQGHVLKFYNELTSDAEKAAFVAQLQKIDPERMAKLIQEALNPVAAKTDNTLEPLAESATATIADASETQINEWKDLGLTLIGNNEVGVILMAGGQGTRLGSSAPKGCFDIGLPSHKSLFQLQAERILKAQELATQKTGGDSAVIAFYIMTSGPTRKPTQDYFEQNNYFGLKKENVIFFEQGTLPCISNEGKIILESKSKVAVAPDGNGGIYRALMADVVPDLKTRGIKHIHAYCVDNALVKVADPVFIGFSASKDVDLATKVVRKRNATESVGLILLKNGKPDVVEYSEIDKETAEARDEKNKDLLKFRAANIVNHYYTTRFLETIPDWVDSLPHHVARKKIPYCDLQTGEQNKPEKPNGIKLEQFVFDIFPRIPLDKFACFEVKREDEFSPLKNARGTGEDDPDTCRAHVLEQGKKWVEAAGAVVTSEEPTAPGVEVSPLMSYAGEGLGFLKGQTVRGLAVIEKQN